MMPNVTRGDRMAGLMTYLVGEGRHNEHEEPHLVAGDHALMAWYDDAELSTHLDAGTTFADFFAAADLNPAATLITGTICGIRVEDVEDPLMQQIRYLDKLVDEVAKGKAMEKILR